MNNNMIRLESSGYLRGSDLFGNERPVRMVSLSPYLIDRLPVTNADFALFIDEGGYRDRLLWTPLGWEFVTTHRLNCPNYWHDPNWNAPQMPITGVSWWEALAYARFLGKTLPTEAQWEFAAGQGQRLYPWGAEAPTQEHANFAPGCEPAELNRRATGVEELPCNFAASGCRDMAGNIGEWCLDNAAQDYSWDLTGHDPIYLTDEHNAHIVRGGSGLHDEDCLRCASRDNYTPSLRDNIVGIRCVKNLS
ncbi:MAG: formylglycine-generating enzyme family protein [Sphingomonadaceae bacterium]